MAVDEVHAISSDLPSLLADLSFSPKPKVEIVAPKKGVPRKLCEFDYDILDCPICYHRYSSHVYQCTNGHAICATCCKKLRNSVCPICKSSSPRTRCLVIEQVMESLRFCCIEQDKEPLRFCCKYADYGCEEMLKNNEIQDHEKNECEFEPYHCPAFSCEFEPYHCPALECKYKGNKVTLAVHLTDEHQVKTVQLNTTKGAVSFQMHPGDQCVMVEGDKNKPGLQYLVFRQVLNELGESIYCSRFGGVVERYSLKVVPLCYVSQLPCKFSYSMAYACAKDLRHVGKVWDGDFLILPSVSLEKPLHEIYDVHFSLQ